MSLRSEKEALRSRMRTVRDAIPETERTSAVAGITERLLHVVGADARTVMVFLSFGSEVATDPICERLSAAGHDLAVPHIEDGELRPVVYRPGDPLVEGVWGIREPETLTSVDPRALDVVVTPGLAFDRRGYRVGYGGGFFDRLLTRTEDSCHRVGIGFHQQVVEAVPHGPKDQPLQMVLTDRETIICA